MRNRWCRRTLMLVVLGTLCIPAWPGQEPPSAPQGTANAQDGGSSSRAQAATISSPQPGVPQVQEIGRAGVLLPQFSTLRWGPIYVNSVDLIQTIDFIEFSGQEPGLRTMASVFRSVIGYDRSFRRSRLAIQYAPRVATVNGRLQHNFSNHNASFDTYYQLTRRWTLGISNQFAYFSNRMLFEEDLNLDLDLTTGRFVQKYFLDSSGRWISDSTNLNLSYQLGPRTRISVTPSYTYSNAREVTSVFESHRYGGTVSLNHDLDDRKSVGVFYSTQQTNFSRSLPNTLYQTFGGTYSQAISATWRISAMLGASAAGNQGTQHWTANGILSVGKTFRSSSLLLAYSRNNDFGNNIGNTYVDRIDGTYNVLLSRRLTAGVGSGYYRELWSHRRNAGLYATTKASYRLSSSVSWFLNYAHKLQHGDGTQVSGGHRNVIATGIHWNPGARQ